MAEINSGTTVYSFIQQEMNNSSALSEKETNKELSNIGAWFSSNMKTSYYMLLNRDINYYTVFNFLSQNFYKGVEELKEVLNSRGAILKIDYSHDNGYYEFWIRHHGEEIASLYLFFPCDDFIIEI